MADNYADFYDGAWDDEANVKNESSGNGLDIFFEHGLGYRGGYNLSQCPETGPMPRFSDPSQQYRTDGNSSYSQPKHGKINIQPKTKLYGDRWF